jgi:hypothetical protein
LSPPSFRSEMERAYSTVSTECQNQNSNYHDLLVLRDTTQRMGAQFPSERTIDGQRLILVQGILSSNMKESPLFSLPEEILTYDIIPRVFDAIRSLVNF